MNCFTDNADLNQKKTAYLVLLQRADLVDHEVVEVRMESVDGTVDANRDVVLAHLDEERRYAGRRQVGRPPRHDGADVSHVLAVLVRCVPDAELGQDFPAVSVFALRITVKNICTVLVWLRLLKN